MRCANCDHVSPDSVAFCVNCGARLTPPPAAGPARSRPVVPALLAVLALLVAVAAGLVYWRGRQDDSATGSANRVATIEPVNDAGSPTPEAATPATAEQVVATAVVEVVPPVAPSKTPAPTATATTTLPTATATTPPAAAEIVFQSNRDGDYDIYIMSLDGGNQRPLTAHSAADNYPRVSPDGRRIAFQSERDGNKEILSLIHI